MRTVKSISLNGNAWQIEAEGCEALDAYLKSAEARLAGDPDRTEILADLEQAIADKLARYVNAHKNVVSAAEIALALKEMGPVETGAADAHAANPEAQAGGAAPGSGADAERPSAGAAADPRAGSGGYGPAGANRHLFRIREGAMFGGVCNGLAAYFGVDVTLVRVLFVLFALFTGGIGLAVYVVMLIIVPIAVTAEQMAAAHGKPFSTEELIGRPLGASAAFDASRHWREQWREQRRMWRDQRKQWRRQRRFWRHPEAPPPPPPYGWHAAPYPGQYAPLPYGFGPVSGLLHAVLLIGFLVALVGAAQGRPLLGWDWTAVVPHWVGIVAVCVIYATLANQLRLARFYGHVAAYHPGHAMLALVGSVVWLLVLFSMGWYVVHHWPQVQDFLQRAVQALQAAFDHGAANSVQT